MRFVFIVCILTEKIMFRGRSTLKPSDRVFVQVLFLTRTTGSILYNYRSPVIWLNHDLQTWNNEQAYYLVTKCPRSPIVLSIILRIIIYVPLVLILIRALLFERIWWIFNRSFRRNNQRKSIRSIGIMRQWALSFSRKCKSIPHGFD